MQLIARVSRVFLPVAALVLFMSASSFAQNNSGIEFFHGSWAEAKAKAKAENKLIFVDAYTTWCGPCRWMASNTFTDSEVGAFYNKKFINVKMDMEKGEGPTLARQWKVRAYPTLLYFDADGNEVKRELGAKRADDFIRIGKSAK
ncbi:MAG: thioredoxin family protein [Saprospiraceae bacterium]|jgi:thiol:disulfide interchange protein